MRRPSQGPLNLAQARHEEPRTIAVPSLSINPYPGLKPDVHGRRRWEGDEEHGVRLHAQDMKPDGTMRKIDYSYIFSLTRQGRTQEVELHRTEIDASWGWRNGNIDDTLENKIRDAIDKL